MRIIVAENSLRFHIEGTDSRSPEEDDWTFLGACDLLQSADVRAETARKIGRKYESTYRVVRIVDTRFEEGE